MMLKRNSKNHVKKVMEPMAGNKKSSFKIFNSFEEQEVYENKYAANLTPIECLQHMRMLINRAYSIPDHTKIEFPKQRTIRFFTR